MTAPHSSDLNVKPGLFRNGFEAVRKLSVWLLMSGVIVGMLILGVKAAQRWG